MMAGEPGRKSKRGRFTISDLGVLIFGIALAIALPWQHYPTAPHESWGIPAAPAWYYVLRAGGEAIWKSCLAMMPILLWRSIRLDRSLRAAEVLVIACAAPLLKVPFEEAGWLSSDLTGVPGAGLSAPEMTRTYWLVLIAIWSVGGAAIVCRFLFRSLLSTWAGSALLVVALLASTTWSIDPLRNMIIDRWLDVGSETLASWSEVAWACIEIFGATVPATLAILAIRDLIRRRSSMVATEWIGLVLCSSLLVVTEFSEWYSNFNIPEDPSYFGTTDGGHVFEPTPTLFLAIPSLSALLGLVIVLTLGPAWRRWTASGYDETSTT